MSRNNYITLRQEYERWGWSRHTVGMTFTSHATYSTRALAEDAARSIAKCKGIPYLPTARGGFDRTPAKSPDPIDIAPPPPWLAVEEPAPAPPQSEQDALIDELTAAAVDAGHDRIIVLKAVDLVKGGHVFDLRFGGEWVVFSEAGRHVPRRPLDLPRPASATPRRPSATSPSRSPMTASSTATAPTAGAAPAPTPANASTGSPVSWPTTCAAGSNDDTLFRGRIRGPLDARTERPPFGNRRQRRAARIHDSATTLASTANLIAKAVPA